MRKRTVFRLCPTHKPYGGGRHTAKMFCEGGPSVGKPCSGEYCTVLPGSDFFAPHVTDALAATWAPNWQINRNDPPERIVPVAPPAGRLAHPAERWYPLTTTKRPADTNA